jgi:hypothetical protein
MLPSVKHQHRPLQLHLLSHFHSHRNHPNLTGNFHHQHFQLKLGTTNTAATRADSHVQRDIQSSLERFYVVLECIQRRHQTGNLWYTSTSRRADVMGGMLARLHAHTSNGALQYRK